MPREYIFWGLMFFWILCGFGVFSPDQNWRNRATFGGNLVLFVLLALLGWTVFGKAIT